MKKLISAALCGMMVLSLAACGSSGSAETTAAATTAAAAGTEAETEAETEAASEAEETETASGTEAVKPDMSGVKTVTEGKLTVATSPDFAPYEFYAIDENGNPQLAGFDMALAQYIADYIGLELEVIPMDFDGTIMELSQGTVDLGMSGYSPSPERLEVMDFSDIYYQDGQAFVCNVKDKDKFTTIEDANKAEYTIGAQTGSIQVGLAEEYTPDANITQMAKVTDLIAELIAGKMDGAFIEKPVAQSYAKNYPDICVALDVPYENDGYVVGVSKGNAELLTAVNAAISACIDSGEFDEYVAEANELAEGNIVEGLVEEQ